MALLRRFCAGSNLHSRLDQRGNPVGRVSLHRGDGMAVHVQRQRHGGVPEPLTHHLDVDAGGESQRRVSVAQVMEPDARQP